jgi:hypothetical protein
MGISVVSAVIGEVPSSPVQEPQASIKLAIKIRQRREAILRRYTLRNWIQRHTRPNNNNNSSSSNNNIPLRIQQPIKLRNNRVSIRMIRMPMHKCSNNNSSMILTPMHNNNHWRSNKLGSSLDNNHRLWEHLLVNSSQHMTPQLMPNLCNNRKLRNLRNLSRPTTPTCIIIPKIQTQRSPDMIPIPLELNSRKRYRKSKSLSPLKPRRENSHQLNIKGRMLMEFIQSAHHMYTILMAAILILMLKHGLSITRRVVLIPKELSTSTVFLV